MAVKNDIAPMLRAATRLKWRAWLRTHHKKKTEIWLVFYKKHTGRKWLTYDEAVEEALCFGWIDGIKKRVDDETFVHRLTPRKPGSSWSPSNRRRVARLIANGRMTRAGMLLVESAKKDGSWSRPTAAQTRFEMPKELDAALRTSRAAKTCFAGLAASQQRQYVAWVASAKREDTRERRAAKALALLKNHQTLGMV